MIELCYSTDLERLNKTNYVRGDKSALISGASRSDVLFEINTAWICYSQLVDRTI
jgi:hypothetical protein